MAPSLLIARSVPEALDALGRLGADAVPVAGATWLMRAPARGKRLPQSMVALQAITALHDIVETADEISLGALLTHDRLAAFFHGRKGFDVLASAAGQSANPGVRRLATLGGNLCTSDFPAADLPPALLVLGAEVELESAGGTRRMPFGEFLASRTERAGPEIMTRVVVPKPLRASTHQRLPLRKAGDYPVAIVSVAAETDGAGSLAAVRVAVGSVEPVARRWTALEKAVTGQPLVPSVLRARAEELTSAFNPRDGVEAPGWYRLRVLPALVERAFAALAAGEKD